MKSAFLNIRVSQICFNNCKHCYMKRNTSDVIDLDDVKRFIGVLRKDGFDQIKVTLIGGEISALKPVYMNDLLEILEGCYVRVVTALNFKTNYHEIYHRIYKTSIEWIKDNGFANTDMNQPIVYSTNLAFIDNNVITDNLSFHRGMSEDIIINLVYEDTHQLHELMYLTHDHVRHFGFNEIKIHLIPNKNLFYGPSLNVNNEQLKSIYQYLCDRYQFTGAYSWHFDGRRCINRTAKEKNFFVINPTGEILPCVYYPYDMNVLKKYYDDLSINNINNIESVEEIYESTLFTDYYSNLQNCSLGKCPIENVYTGVNHD